MLFSFNIRILRLPRVVMYSDSASISWLYAIPWREYILVAQFFSLLVFVMINWKPTVVDYCFSETFTSPPWGRIIVFLLTMEALTLGFSLVHEMWTEMMGVTSEQKLSESACDLPFSLFPASVLDGGCAGHEYKWEIKSCLKAVEILASFVTVA